MKKISCLSITPELGTTIFYTGPSLDRGPMPAVFYFALSGEEALCKDPYNQPVQFLSEFPIRIFSLTLPEHDLGIHPNEALKSLAEDLEKKRNPVENFLDKMTFCLDYLEKEKLLEKEKTALAGLSRGCFFASHVANREEKIPFLLHFAPLTKLSYAQDFKHIENIDSYDLENLSETLYNRHLRMYIGNRDLRVGTENAFSLCQNLSEKAFSKGIRSPTIEMVINPSIGHQGHGTSPETFKDGALWLANLLTQKK